MTIRALGSRQELGSKRWLHGDLKDMAFFYNFKLFEHVVDKGGLK